MFCGHKVMVLDRKVCKVDIRYWPRKEEFVLLVLYSNGLARQSLYSGHKVLT